MELTHEYQSALFTAYSTSVNDIRTGIFCTPQIVITSVGRTFLYNPLMLFYAISSRLREDKEDKKSLSSSVARDIKQNETTKKTMLRSISEDEEEEKGAR